MTYLKKNYPFINDFKSSIYERKYFFDQWYHMNKCGKDLSTQKLIKELVNTGSLIIKK